MSNRETARFPLATIVAGAVIALTSIASADSTDTRRAAANEVSVESLPIVELSMLWWERATHLMTPPDESLAGQEVAARVLRMTAVGFPGVPLPDIGKVAVPVINVRPVKKSVLTSQFGWRRHPITRRSKLHAGMDFSADPGTPVLAAGDGVVIKAERMGGYGRIVIVDHGAGFVTRYAHLRRILVKEGERVPAGSRIGTVGSSGRVTGPHLHFEIRVLGQPVDPAPILGIKTRGFAERLRDLLTLPGRVAPPSKNKRVRRSRRSKS